MSSCRRTSVHRSGRTPPSVRASRLRLPVLGIFLALACVSAGIAAPAMPARAQSGIDVTSDEPKNNFPDNVTFNLAFTADAAPKEVRIFYELAPDGTGATAVAQCNGTTSLTCSYALTNGRGIELIPGANITYHWEITRADGSQFKTDDKLFVYDDTRFTFKTLQSGNVTLYYHAGSQSAAQQVLDAAVGSLQKVSALEQTQVTFPVKVFLYQTAEEMQPAIVSGSIGRGVVVLGEVVYSDTAMVSADADPLNVTRHEVAHIVTREATKGPYGIDSWLNEGISVWAQDEVLQGHAQALQSAIQSDSVLSLRDLSSPSAGDAAQTVNLFYGESGSIVRFLIDKYGADKFAELLRTFKDGSTPDDAYQKVYGFDTIGLENAWRASLGLTPRPTPTAPNGTPAPSTAVPVATSAGASQGSSSGGRNIAELAAIAVLGVVVVGSGAGAYITLRRRL